MNFINTISALRMCQYKDIFGQPLKGFHSQRIFGLALWDIVGTIVISIIVSKIFNLNYIKTLLIAFALGTVLHLLFCVQTPITNFITSL